MKIFLARWFGQRYVESYPPPDPVTITSYSWRGVIYFIKSEFPHGGGNAKH